MKLITFPVGLLMLLASAAICGMESCSYYNVSVWHGNVRLTSDWTDAEGVLVQNFDYGDGRHGWVKSNQLVLQNHQGRVLWMWCDVTHSGRASHCGYKTKEQTAK